jgi:hypothetical protein
MEAMAHRLLPQRRAERIAWLILAATLLVLKGMAIIHYRVDSDETQHAHVVWAWSRGQLPYRDFFDNHMPLFHMALAPFFALLGEHAYIMVELRLAMLPFSFLCLWCVFKLTASLYSVRIAPWVTLVSAALPAFFYTSTEFRPDILWAAVWLLALVVALCGPFTLRRAFVSGILLGLALAVSIKTPVLWAALAVSIAIAFGLNAWLGREKLPWLRIPLFVFVTGAGAALVPGAVLLFFATQGALPAMIQCVIRHNMLPGFKRWNHIAFNRWLFPTSIPALIGFGLLIFRQAPDCPTAMRRVILLLTPCAFAALLFSYSPEVTRQDGLPYFPLLPLAAVPFLVWLGKKLTFPAVQSAFFAWIIPALCFAELLLIWNSNPLRSNRMETTTTSIRDVLLLTGRDDYVMDSEGDYIFRKRPYYWVFETITKARIRRGLIPDNLPAALKGTATPLCYLYSEHLNPATSYFIVTNYISFDPDALDLGVAGKELSAPSSDGTFTFDVAIPATYAVVNEIGATAGMLDGAPYLGPEPLAAGHHIFRRTSGAGRAAIILARAEATAFHPLFDASEKIISQERTRSESAD